MPLAQPLFSEKGSPTLVHLVLVEAESLLYNLTSNLPIMQTREGQHESLPKNVARKEISRLSVSQTSAGREATFHYTA